MGRFDNTCLCWSDDGKHRESEQDCNEPIQCVVYNATTDGDFKFVSVPANGSQMSDTLTSWKVPTELIAEYKVAALTSSADFKTFDVIVNSSGFSTYEDLAEAAVEDGRRRRRRKHGPSPPAPSPPAPPTPKIPVGSFEAHVGSLRNYNGTIYLGYIYGTAKGQLVQPYKRTASPGHCNKVAVHGGFYPPGYGVHKRGFNGDDLMNINQGLSAYAFEKAAKLASPP